MDIFTTIIPIFAIVLLGWVSRKKGFIHAEFIGPANSLVFYLAIPAMVFSAISRATLTNHFNVGILVITLSTVVVGFALAWVSGKIYKLKHGQLGSYVQTSFHGNLGYVGLAVAFYYLGEEGFVKASILTGILMVAAKPLVGAVFDLQRSPAGSSQAWQNHRPQPGREPGHFIGHGRHSLFVSEGSHPHDLSAQPRYPQWPGAPHGPAYHRGIHLLT